MIAPASQTPVSTAPPFWQRWFSGNGWISLASVATVLALWWVASHAGWVSPLFLPTPEAVIKAFADIVVNGYKGVPLLFHIWESLYRLGVALVLAVVIAVPLGMACGAFDKLRAVVEPLIEFYRPLPPLAYYTLLVIWLGIENASKIALLFLAAFAPLFLAAVAGVQRVPRDRILGSQSLGANRWQIFRYVIFPLEFRLKRIFPLPSEGRNIDSLRMLRGLSDRFRGFFRTTCAFSDRRVARFAATGLAFGPARRLTSGFGGCSRCPQPG
jgi:ABC-type nitrate/sulfonate/bicarbonate transport system permease component